MKNNEINTKKLCKVGFRGGFKLALNLNLSQLRYLDLRGGFKLAFWSSLLI